MEEINLPEHLDDRYCAQLLATGPNPEKAGEREAIHFKRMVLRDLLDSLRVMCGNE